MLREPAIVIFASLATSACGTATEPEDEGLTAAETDGLVEMLVSTALFPSPSPETNPSPCPQGGTVSRALYYYYSQPNSLAREGSVTLAECAAVAGGRQYSVSGTVAVQERWLQDALGKVAGREGSYDGKLSWALGNRSGSCLLMLTLAAANEGFSVTGTVCDRQVEQAV